MCLVDGNSPRETLKAGVFRRELPTELLPFPVLPMIKILTTFSATNGFVFMQSSYYCPKILYPCPGLKVAEACSHSYYVRIVRNSYREDRCLFSYFSGSKF